MDKPEHLRPAHPDQCVILVAEDDVMVRNVARVVLEGEGYFILSADNGEEGLLIARRYPGPIHVLLSDVRMPVMNGLDLAARMLQERPTTKVVLMSGETLAMMPAVPFLRKPFGPQELRATIERVIATIIAAPCAKLRTVTSASRESSPA